MAERAPESNHPQARNTADRSLSVFVAHEINNPLESIMNLLYLLEKEPLTPQGMQHLAAIREEVARVAEIARSALDGYRSRPAEMLDLPMLADSVLALYSARIEAKRIVLIRQYRSEGSISLRASRMRELFANLFLNAIDALPATGGMIAVRIGKAHEWRGGERIGVKVSVADNGSGIQQQSLRRIFEPFFTTKGTQGSGMGLSVVDEIVKEHGGTVRVKSRTRPGSSGTVFTIFLPCT